MKNNSMREWLLPTLGAALLLVGAGGLAYKVIIDYRHAAPDAFVSVQDQNKLAAASAANRAVETPAASGSVSTQLKRTLSAAQTAPSTAAPTVAPGGASKVASSAAADGDLPAEAQDNPACAAIKTEQHEIEGARNKQYSPEEGRYMQRRLRELAEQSVKRKCAE